MPSKEREMAPSLIAAWVVIRFQGRVVVVARATYKQLARRGVEFISAHRTQDAAYQARDKMSG